MQVKLNVVDQSPVHGSHAPHQALQLTVDLAQACDGWGYHRYWVAEHHDSEHFANPSPEILVATLAARTEKIRVGSGGVMLSHYSPLKVAECFMSMESLYPNRIDLGIGRAPGGSGLASQALAFPHRPLHGDAYAEQASQLAGFVRGDLPANHPFATLKPVPDTQAQPELWMLGSSGGSAEVAGHLGYNLALARFINPAACHPSIFDKHLQAWHAAGHKGSPQRILAIACICAESTEQAKLVAGTAAYRKLSMQTGALEPLLTPEQVSDRYRVMPESQKAMFDKILAEYTVGNPDECLDEISQLAKVFGCDEVALITVTHSQQERLDSYRLLAEHR